MFEKKERVNISSDPSVLEYMRSISSSDIVKPDVEYLSDWFDEWITNYTVHLSPATLHSYRTNTECHIKRVLGHATSRYGYKE